MLREAVAHRVIFREEPRTVRRTKFERQLRPPHIKRDDRACKRRHYNRDNKVIDKMMPRERPPAGFSLSECEKLTDFTLPATIKCLYHTVCIPRGVRKVVVTNECDAWPCDPHGRIVGRRVAQLHITKCLY